MWRRVFNMVAGSLIFFLVVADVAVATAQDKTQLRIDSSRFTFFAHQQDVTLARSLLALAVASDTFPGLPRPQHPAVIVIAPDVESFRKLVGANVPEWGAAVAFPSIGRIVLQSPRTGSEAGDTRVVLRHELAHLILHEFLGDLPPRWFDEGYASLSAREWGREAVLAANLLLVMRGAPKLDSLNRGFHSGANVAQSTYAFSHTAVAQLQSLDRDRGLALFFGHWQETRSLDRAVREAYGITLADFEALWHKAVRRKYGALALVSDLGLIGGAVLLLFLPAWLSRRKRQRLRLEELRKSERLAEQRLAEEVLRELIGGANRETGSGGVQ